MHRVFPLILGALAACTMARAQGDAASPATPSSPPATATSCAAGRHLRVHFYNVGQALSALVDLPDGRHLLIDTGDSPSRPDCGDACLAKNQHLLAKLRDDLHGAPIDLLWITHQHSDHLGGAPEVLASFQVGAYVDNGRDEAKGEVARAHRAAARRDVPVLLVDPTHRASPVPDAPGLTITPIVPPAWPASCAHDANECSIGLRIDFCASSVLFTGDAEREEESLLDLRGPVTLLQVAHHGSETSSSPRFLARAGPRYAVISAGKPFEGLNHDYCHPRAAVVERLTRALGGATPRPLLGFGGERCDHAQATDWSAVPASDHLWATERDGDVVLTTTGDGTFTREAP
jgi:competence protein ComEC